MRHSFSPLAELFVPHLVGPGLVKPELGALHVKEESGTNVFILKLFSTKKLAKMVFLTLNTAIMYIG
jgi:hypothetical protein